MSAAILLPSQACCKSPWLGCTIRRATEARQLRAAEPPAEDCHCDGMSCVLRISEERQPCPGPGGTAGWRRFGMEGQRTVEGRGHEGLHRGRVRNDRYSARACARFGRI